MKVWSGAMCERSVGSDKTLCVCLAASEEGACEEGVRACEEGGCSALYTFYLGEADDHIIPLIILYVLDQLL